MPVFGHKIWVALIIVVGLQLVNTVAADGPPPDVSAVFTLNSFFGVIRKKMAPLLSCVTADKNTVITTHNILEHWDRIRLTGPAVNKTAEYNDDGRGLPWGVVCRPSDQYHNYDVTTPFRYFNDSYTPTKLSYTLDPDQDLVVDVDQDLNRTNQGWWKAGGSDRRTNIINGRLTIPHQELETGIYHLGTTSSSFSLLVRECTSGLYGPPDCTKDCPECRNGGMCHPQTGYCVCPPGVMGSLCQNRCPHNTIGKDCTVKVPYTAGVAVCVPHPVGCTCLPGYQGRWCEEECNNGHFGADCQGDCECSEDDCDKATGFCNQDNGYVVSQVIVGVMALVIVVGSVGVLCWCLWTKKNQRVAHRPTENRNEPGPSASVASQQSPHYPQDSEGMYEEPILPTGPVPVTIRNPLWVIKQNNDNTRLPSVLEPQANEEEHIYEEEEEEHIYEEVDDFFVYVQPGALTAHFHNIP